MFSFARKVVVWCTSSWQWLQWLVVALALVGIGLLLSRGLADARPTQDNIDSYLCQEIFAECRRSLDSGLCDETCPGCYDRTGTVRPSRLALFESTEPLGDGEFAKITFLGHENGGLHRSRTHPYTTRFTIITREAWLPNGPIFQVPDDKFDIYFEWFDRFKVGEATFAELDELLNPNPWAPGRVRSIPGDGSGEPVD